MCEKTISSLDTFGTAFLRIYVFLAYLGKSHLILSIFILGCQYLRDKKVED